MAPFVFVFLALPCEAKPFIQHWRLKKCLSQHPFAIYHDEQRVLVVSGVGHIAMAGAVAYTLALYPERRQPILLNIGIAGHEEYALGGLYLAHKILNTDTGKSFYPQFPFATVCRSASVASFSKPVQTYPPGSLCDMEAAGFYEMATKFSSSEIVHSLKIVSDNAVSPLENIRENQVQDWISQHLGTVDRFVTDLCRLRDLLPVFDDKQYRECLAAFHFTASNALRLKDLLRQWQLLSLGELCVADRQLRSAAELLLWLQQEVERKEFYL